MHEPTLQTRTAQEDRHVASGTFDDGATSTDTDNKHNQQSKGDPTCTVLRLPCVLVL